jgi:hypothetical protein
MGAWVTAVGGVGAGAGDTLDGAEAEGANAGFGAGASRTFALEAGVSARALLATATKPRARMGKNLDGRTLTDMGGRTLTERASEARIATATETEQPNSGLAFDDGAWAGLCL